MKLGYWVLFMVLFAGLNSCMWGVPKKQHADVTRDTLAYTYQTIKQRAADCGTKPDSGCAVAIVHYPVFKKANLLNDTVAKKLTGLFAINKSDTSLQLMCSDFLQSYDDFKKDKAERKGNYFTLNSYAKVLRQDSSLVTLEVGGYTYTGGAHGATFVYFINWDTRTNKNLLLTDILNKGYEELLTKAGEAVFRNDEKLSDIAPLARDYFFRDGKFSLNKNFLITPIGIRFLYNSYEIKPYAAGRTDLFIPYAQFKPLLQPNTVVTQYLK
jgi:hypothetical protein